MVVKGAMALIRLFFGRHIVGGIARLALLGGGIGGFSADQRRTYLAGFSVAFAGTFVCAFADLLDRLPAVLRSASTRRRGDLAMPHCSLTRASHLAHVPPRSLWRRLERLQVLTSRDVMLLGPVLGLIALGDGA